MVKTPNEPVFKKIVREGVREELKPIEARLSGFEVFKIEIATAFDNAVEKVLAGVAKMRDKIIKELEITRQESAITSDKVRLINELDDRVDTLEKIHSHGSHSPLPA